MKKNVFLSLVVILLITSTNFLSAQSDYNGFNLKDYYTPDIVRNSLEFNLSLYGNSSNYINLLDNETYRSSSSEFHLNNTNISFSNLKNTRKKISTIGLGLNPSLDYYKYSHGDTLFTFTHSEGAHWNNRLYYNPKYFITYNVSLSHNGNYDKSNVYGINKNSNVNFRPTVGWGKGRIESVKDARQTIYILDELKKNGVLSRDMTKDEIFEFAQLISTVKNKRFLDSRLHRIDEITTIDNYLKKKDVLSNTDAAYFTTLYDMWEYGDLFDRNSGAVFSLNVSPLINYQWDYSKLSSSDALDNQYFSYGAAAEIGFNYSKPVKLNWQHDFSVNLDFGFENYKNLKNTEFSLSYFPYGGLNYKLGYYPNTRTNIYAQTRYNVSYSKTKDVSGYELNNVVNLGGGMNYYVSQNLRLSADLNLTNFYREAKSPDNNHFRNQKHLNFNYGFTMSYLFF